MHLQHIHDANVSGLERKARIAATRASARRKKEQPAITKDRAIEMSKALGNADILISFYEALHGTNSEQLDEAIKLALSIELWELGFKDAALNIYP